MDEMLTRMARDLTARFSGLATLRFSRTARIGFAAACTVVALLVVAPFLVPANQFRSTIEQRASSALGRHVSLGRLRVSLLRQSLSAETLTVADDPAFSASPFLTAKSVTVGVELFPLIVSRSLNVTDIRVEQPVVTLVRNASGRWNYSSLATSSSGTSSDFAIGKLELSDGRVLVGSATQTRAYDHVNVATSNVSPGSRWPILANAVLPGGGTFSLTGDVGPMDRADTSLTPVDATVAIDGLDLAKTGFLNPSAGGLLDLTATIASKGGVADIAGQATLSKALLVAGGSPASRQVVVSFSSRYALRSHTGALLPSSLKMGGAAARLAGTYDKRGDATVVNITVSGGRMPATELESFLPALGIHLPQGAHLSAGTIETNLKVAGAIGRLVATGSAGLFKARLTGFDLGSKMRVISAFTGLQTGNDLDIERLTTNVRLAPDGLRFDHFTGVIASLGQITGAGTIDARNNLHFGMVATLANATLPNPVSAVGGGGGAAEAIGSAIGTTGVLGGLLGTITRGSTAGKIAGAAGHVAGATGHVANQRIPFLVEGTTSNPQIIPDLSGVALRMLEGQLGATP
jgi:AsmA protein